VIGGKDQSGEYRLDCRFDRADLVHKIKRIASYRDRVHLTRLDAEELIIERLPEVPRDTLVSIDPPYYTKGSGLYTSFYQHNGHASLVKAVAQIRQRWIVTYDNMPEIRRIHRKYRIHTQHLMCCAQVKRAGVELLMLDPKIKLPVESYAAWSCLIRPETLFPVGPLSANSGHCEKATRLLRWPSRRLKP